MYAGAAVMAPDLSSSIFMKTFLLYLLTGMLVGIIYALAKVRSPLPSMLVIVSFAGMFLGEQLPAWIEQYRHGEIMLLRPKSQQQLPVKLRMDAAPQVQLSS